MIIYLHKEVKYIHELILFILSILISIHIISTYILNKKIKNLKVKSNNFNNNKLFSKNLFKNLKSELIILKNPYGLNFRNYIFLKYIFSIFVFILMFIRTSNIIISLVYFFIIYFIPNILIYLFKKNESIVIIDDLLKITENLLLSLSSNMSVYKSLKISISLVKYNRLKEELSLFISDYEMYNFNIEKSVDNIRNKFNSFEFNIFLDILVQGEKEGKLISNLEMFSETLELSYFKTLKYKESKRITLVVMSCIVCLINISVTAIYPLFTQVISSIGNILA